MTNRTTQALIPGSARDIAFKAVILWHCNRLSNKLNIGTILRHSVCAGSSSIMLSRSIARLSACALWLLPLCLSPSLHPWPILLSHLSDSAQADLHSAHARISGVDFTCDVKSSHD